MLRIRILLGTALGLTVLALASLASKPLPRVQPPGYFVQSHNSPVKVEVKPSHRAVFSGGTEVFAELTVTLEEAQATADAPISLALVLDTSGSMSGQKLADAQRAAHRLVDLLRDDDELSLVSFGTELLVTERQRLNAASRERFHAAIHALQAAGSTNISGGLEAGWNSLRGAQGGKRLVLVSDGQPTVGLVTDPELSALVGRVHDDAITVTALGVGADIDGMLMQHLSERGGGMYGYLQNASALEELLGREVDNARRAVARNVELQLTPRGFYNLDVPGRHPDWRAGVMVLHLADLRPNLPTRVLVRVQSASGEAGLDERALEAQVSWRRVGGEPERTQVAISLPVVDDLALVTATRDEAVFSRGIGAAGSAKLVLAAAAYERGDDAAASSLLDNARSLFSMSADALAGEAEVDSVRTTFKSQGASERKESARKLERKKLVNFGRENEGY